VTSTYTISPELQQEILRELGARVVKSGEHRGDFWVQVHGKDVLGVVHLLQSNQAFAFDAFVDLCGVDYLERKPRFESVIHLYSTAKKHRIRLRCLVPDDTLSVPSLTQVWRGANWQEREAFDLYGIRYEGHPNLSRILSAPDVTIHAQRKDFPLRGDREPKEDL